LRGSRSWFSATGLFLVIVAELLWLPRKCSNAEVVAARTFLTFLNFRKTFVTQLVPPADGERFFYADDAIAAIPFRPTITND